MIRLVKPLILFIVLLISNFSLAQEQQFEWMKSIGGTSYDHGYKITTDDDGNVYTIGSFDETVDFNPNAGIYNLTSEGEEDIFIQKMDMYGTLIWVKQISGDEIKGASSISIDSNKNIYISGAFAGSVDFDPDTSESIYTSNGLYDAFVLKIDSIGNFVWIRQFIGDDRSNATKVLIDENGNIILSGVFFGAVDFDPGPGIASLIPYGDYDGFVLKLSPAGDYVWANRLGGAYTDFINSTT